MKVTCLKLGSQVTLQTERGEKIPFVAGTLLMILFSDDEADTRTDYYVCSAGGGLPFVWVARNSTHERLEIDFEEWKAANNGKYAANSRKDSESRTLL